MKRFIATLLLIVMCVGFLPAFTPTANALELPTTTNVSVSQEGVYTIPSTSFLVWVDPSAPEDSALRLESSLTDYTPKNGVWKLYVDNQGRFIIRPQGGTYTHISGRDLDRRTEYEQATYTFDTDKWADGNTHATNAGLVLQLIRKFVADNELSVSSILQTNLTLVFYGTSGHAEHHETYEYDVKYEDQTAKTKPVFEPFLKSYIQDANEVKSLNDADKVFIAFACQLFGIEMSQDVQLALRSEAEAVQDNQLAENVYTNYLKEQAKDWQDLVIIGARLAIDMGIDPVDSSAMQPIYDELQQIASDKGISDGTYQYNQSVGGRDDAFRKYMYDVRSYINASSLLDLHASTLDGAEDASGDPFAAVVATTLLDEWVNGQGADKHASHATLYSKAHDWPAEVKIATGIATNMIKVTESGELLPDVQKFVQTAYSGENVVLMRDYLYPSVRQPKNQLIRNGQVNHLGYAMLIVSYQEFGMYAARILRDLEGMLTDQHPDFVARREQITLIKEFKETLDWLNDASLWAVWESKPIDYFSTDSERVTVKYSLRDIYDFLLSQNAFAMVENYDPTKMQSPFRYFFNDKTLSDYIQTGVYVSSTFQPMRTNLYDPYTWSNLVDNDWLLNFHAKFGYNRKALYIDDNADAAMNFARTGTRGSLRVATLQDVLMDKDVVLYIDDNLYNVNTIAEIVGKAYDRLDNVDNESTTLNWWGSFKKTISGLWNVSMENLAKTAEVTSYSTNVNMSKQKWKDFFFDLEPSTAVIDETGSESSEVISTNIMDYLGPDTVWDKEAEQVDPSSTAYTYSPLLGFATLSAVYLGEVTDGQQYSTALRNQLNSVLNSNTPVFVSSGEMPYIAEDISSTMRNSIYNYMLLRNLDSQMTVDYATNIDMTSPVYMDIYGNILTESGVVVIPAAANATLYKSTYLPYTTAMASCYGDDWYLPYNEDAERLNALLDATSENGGSGKGMFVVRDGVWVLRSVRTLDGTLDLARLSTASKDTMAALMEVFQYRMNEGNYDLTLWKMLITEVLRGAPIECIDKDFEGLNLSHRVTKQGLLVAEKLEFLANSLSNGGQNATLSIPNPAYMDGLEYIVFFAYKVLILGILVIWMINIYYDTAGGQLSLRTMWRCFGVLVLVLALIVGVPGIFELSYYQSNKALLQDETEYLMMLNLEKQQNGHEIGITDVHEPETNTKLYLKLSDIELPWYDLLPKIALSSSYKNLEELYADYEGQNPITAVNADLTIIDDTVYISTDQLFDSSVVTFSPTTEILWQRGTGNTPASYYTPYYYFLDQIINQVNQWCRENHYYSYSTKIQRGGRLKTLGYVQPYFQSEEFTEEGNDFFGLYRLYNVTAPRVYAHTANVETTIDALRNSQWCNLDMGEESCIKRIQKLNTYAQLWVARNQDMLGKVSDETFLKCFALACAMEHNRLFNTLHADNLEIKELSNEDLMRLSIADPTTVMKTSTMSYARFVYSVGGTPAVYGAAILMLVQFISSWVKPICTLLVFLIACVSIFVLKLILRRGNNSIYGYAITIGIMCLVNIIGSVFIKLSMYIPRVGFTPTVCILIQIVVQAAYIFLLVKVVEVALKDWRNVGFQRYNAAAVNMRLPGMEARLSTDPDTPRQENGWEYYNRLTERQQGRRKTI